MIVQADGIVGAEELVASHVEFTESQMDELRNCRTWFVDFSTAVFDDTKSSDIRELAVIAVGNSEQMLMRRVAFCTPADMNFGLARMWEALADETGWEIQVFRSKAEATAWLDEIGASEHSR